MSTSVTVQFQGLSTDKLNSDTTCEYAVLALTVLQMFATMSNYPASSGIAISLFALVALGVNRYIQYPKSLATYRSSVLLGLQAAILEVVFYPFYCSHHFRSCAHFCCLLGIKRVRRWFGFLASCRSVRSIFDIRPVIFPSHKKWIVESFLSLFTHTFELSLQVGLCMLHYGASFKDLRCVLFKD
jgi:hypothetical protein